MNQYPNYLGAAPYATLRDYFAAAAMSGMMKEIRRNRFADEKMQAIHDADIAKNISDSATVAYQIADAMLEERQK